MTETVSDERLRQLGEFVEKLDWCIHNDDITDIGAAFKELLALRTPPQNTDGEAVAPKVFCAMLATGVCDLPAKLAAAEAERDALAKAARHAFDCIAFPVATEIDQRGYSLHHESERLEYAAEVLSAHLQGDAK